MPNVSVLIPAFRPDYLDAAVASVLAQSYTDFELIISDDSDEPFVESVVSKWSDPRMRLVRNPSRRLPGANRDHLLRIAQGKYIKFLFDDDFLLPQSIRGLVNLIEETGSQMAFHGRHFVDERGCVLSSSSVVASGHYAFLDKRKFFEDLLGATNNFIGEPSNVLFATDALRKLERPFAICEFPMRYLTDVALYGNFLMHDYKVVGAGFMGSAFRKHRQQNSNTLSPIYSAGLFEWEVLLRWSVDRGELDKGRYRTAITLLHEGGYRRHVHVFPELAPFLELGGRPGPNAYWSSEFREALSLAYVAIEMRQLALAQA